MEEQGEEVSRRSDEYFSALNCFLDQVEQGVRSRCAGTEFETLWKLTGSSFWQPIASTPTPYENCCEAAFETLKKNREGGVPEAPNWMQVESEWDRGVQEARSGGFRLANQATACTELVRKKSVEYLILALHKPFEGNGVKLFSILPQQRNLD